MNQDDELGAVASMLADRLTLEELARLFDLMSNSDPYELLGELEAQVDLAQLRTFKLTVH